MQPLNLEELYEDNVVFENTFVTDTQRDGSFVLPPSIIGSCIPPAGKPQYCGFPAGGSMVFPQEGVSILPPWL